MAKNKKVKEEGKFKPRAYEDTFEHDANWLEALSTQINKDLIEGQADKQEWLDEQIINNAAYYGVKKQTDWPFKNAAKISSQMHRIMVDTTKANLLASVTAPEQLLKAETSKAQSVDEAKYVVDLNNAIATREYSLPEVLDRAWPQALIESFVVLKPIYRFELLESYNTIKRWLPKEYKAEGLSYDSDTNTVIDANGAPVPSLSEDQVTDDLKEALHECTLEITKEHVQEGIKVLSIPGSRIYVPISAPGETPFEKFQRAPYVIEDDYKTVQEMEILKQQEKIKNFDIVVGELSSTLEDETLQHFKEQQTGAINFNEISRRLCRNIWWNGKFEYKGKLRELRVYRNCETGVILKVIVNNEGIRPYFPQVPFPVDGTPFGESECKQIRELVRELELMMNTVINMGLIKAYPPKFFDPLSGFDPKTLGAVGPNAYIPVRDPSRNVFMPPMPEDPRILMEMIRFTQDLIERATANSDTVQGQSAPTNSTKFEIEQKLVRAGVRFDMIYKRLKAQLAPMFPYINKLLLKHMPLEKEVAIMGPTAIVKGEDGSEMSRLQLIYQQEGEYGITLKGNSVMEEQQKLQNSKELLMLFAQQPYMNYLSFKPHGIYYALFNLIQHYNPVGMDEILAKPEEVAQLLRDRAQVQNEQEQMAVEEGKQSVDQQAMIQAQMAQMELQLKAQQAQIDAAKQQQDMELNQQKQAQELQFKQQEHAQKMRQMEEMHKLKMEALVEESKARAKATVSKPKSSN